MFCRNCGKQLPDGAKFCGNCGTPVAAPAAPWAPGPGPEAVPSETDEPAGAVMAEQPAAEVPAEPPVERVEESAPEAPEANPADGTATGDEGQAPSGTPAEPPVEPVEESAAETAAENAAETAEESAPEAPEEGKSAGPAGSGAPVNMPKFDIPCTEAQPQGADGAPPAKRRNKAVFAVIGVAAVVLIALVAVGIWMITRLMGGGGKILCVYLNDEGELMYLSSLKEDTKAVEIAEIADEVDHGVDVKFSRDGKTVYFRDVDGTLYQIAAADLEKDGGKPDRIARDVSRYQVLDGGRVLYAEYNGDDGTYKVSLYEDGQSSRLAKGCDEWSLSGDEKALYYTEADSDEGSYIYTYTLYRAALDGDGKAEKLLEDYDELYTDWDAETLVYGVRTEAQTDEETGRTDGNTLTVYSAKPGEKGTQLVSDVYSVRDVTAEGGKVNFLYFKENVEQSSLYDYVTDTNADADAAILEEGEPLYPNWSDYEPVELLLEGGKIYYVNAKGDSCPVDLQVYQGENAMSVEEMYEVYYWDILYGPAWEDADERYQEECEDYRWSRYDWNIETIHDCIREGLKKERRDQTTYTLLRYTGDKDGETVATGLGNSFYYGGGDVLAYRKTEGAEVTQVADVHEVMKTVLMEGYGVNIDDDSALDMFINYVLAGGYNDDIGNEAVYMVQALLGDDNTGSSQWYQNVGGKESPLDLDEEDTLYGMYQLSDKEVVFWLSDGDEDRLDSYTVGADGLTLSDTIYEGELSPAGTSVEPDGKTALYLFTETEADNNYNTLGDFSVYRDGKLETIAKEVYGAVVLDESGATYVFTDVDSEYNIELAVLQDGKPVTISDEAEDSGIFLDGGRLLYVSDSDLYLWDGKESCRIARDVEYVWTSYEESYRGYNP